VLLCYNDDNFGKEEFNMIKQYVVDAFTDRVFGGNPAAICILEQWISDELMILQ